MPYNIAPSFVRLIFVVSSPERDKSGTSIVDITIKYTDEDYPQKYTFIWTLHVWINDIVTSTNLLNWLYNFKLLIYKKNVS